MLCKRTFLSDANKLKSEIMNSTTTERQRRRVASIMTENVIVAAPDTFLQAAAKMMRDGDIGILPVTNAENKLVGVITDRDIVIRAVAEGRDIQTTVAGEIMTDRVFTVRPTDFVFEAIRLMGDKQIRRLPVVDEAGILRGILSIADVALESEDEREIAEALEDISSGAGFWKKA